MVPLHFPASFSHLHLCGSRRNRFVCRALLAAAAAGLSFGSMAFADPLPGEVLKFYQAPLNLAGPIYPPGAVPSPLDVPASPRFAGHDELSTAFFNSASAAYTGTMMADDFGDNLTTPIVHVMFWGSYMNNTAPPTGTLGVQEFQITFYTDNPGVPGANVASTPLIPYSSQTVKLATAPLTSGSGTFTETLVPNAAGSPNTGDSAMYQYNAELAMPVAEPVATNPLTGQTGPAPIGTVDWISIVALVGGPNGANTNLEWGWHDRDYGIFDPLAIGANPTGPGENNLNPTLSDPNGQPVWHFQDDAVSNPTFTLNSSGVPSASPTAYLPQTYIPGVDIASSQAYSKDLAFALYTAVPEPTSLGLLAIAGVATLGRRKRRIG